MTKRFTPIWTLLLVLSMLFGAMVPAVTAQDDTLISHLDDYMTNLPSSYGLIRASDLATELVDAPPVLVDVRQPEEYEAGHIEGAINLPLRELAQHIDMLPDLDANIVTYCKSGHRGTLGMVALQALGYTNVRNLYGGIQAWEGEEYPTVTDPTAAEAGTAPNIDTGVFGMVDAMLTNIPEGWGVVTPDNLNISLAEETAPFLLDVRTMREVAAGYIEGVDAIIEVHSLVSERGMLPEDKATPIVAYCGSGWRSAIAEAALWMMGYENVLSLAGGRRGWEAAGYPMVQDMAYVAEYYTADVMPTGDDGWSNVSPEAVGEALAGDEPPFLLDVREPGELDENGYIPGAVNIPVRQVGQNIDKLPADLEAPIVVYCAKGTRGTFVTTALQMLGFANVRNLNGGFGAWADAGLEVATDPVAAPEAGEMAEVDAFVLEHVDTALANWPEGWGMVAPDALSEMMADAATAPAAVIDVRNPEEWVTDGVIEDATLVPLVSLGAYVAELEAMVPDKTATIVVYCKAGHRGAIGTTVLRAAGFENVLNLSGGFDGWVAAGMPVAEAPAD